MKRFIAPGYWRARLARRTYSFATLAAFIEGNLRPTGTRFLRLRSEGARASH